MKKKKEGIPAFLRRDPGEEPKNGTHKIQAKIFRGNKVKRLVFREFASIVQARDYFIELTTHDGDEISDMSGNCHVTELVSGITICSNYSMEKILKGIQPKQKLHIIMDPRDIRKRSVETAKMPEPKIKPAKARKRKISSGETIPIKKLCQQLEIDPRKARQKLRKASKDGKIPHIEKGRWDFDPSDIDLITTILIGKKKERRA